MKRLVFALVLLLVTVAACVKTPPNLSPAGVTASQNLQIQNPLDVLRNFAQAGNATTPPLFSTATATAVTKWHEAAIKTVNARLAGWQTTVTTGLDQILTTFSAAERASLAPYVALIKAALTAVIS